MGRGMGRVTKRRNIKSKWQMSEERRDTATYRDCSGQVHQREHDTHTHKKETANMHHQWKLTVNSQNRATVPHTDRFTSLTVSLQTLFWR